MAGKTATGTTPPRTTLAGVMAELAALEDPRSREVNENTVTITV